MSKPKRQKNIGRVAYRYRVTVKNGNEGIAIEGQGIA
jgi:hypothetical protein